MQSFCLFEPIKLQIFETNWTLEQIPIWLHHQFRTTILVEHSLKSNIDGMKEGNIELALAVVAETFQKNFQDLLHFLWH